MRIAAAAMWAAVLLMSSLVAGSAAGQSPPRGEVASRFFGAWRYVGTSIDGKPREGRGANPKGIIYYDPNGAMAVQIAPDRYVERAGAETSAEEAKAAIAGYVAYFGTYSIDEGAGTVTHHRLGSV